MTGILSYLFLFRVRTLLIPSSFPPTASRAIPKDICWMDEGIDGWVGGWTDGWMGGQMGGWVCGWVDGWEDERIDGCTGE